MREMKDSGYDWLGKIPSNWDLRRGRYLFAQRNEKGNGLCLQLLSPSQKLGVIPQKLLEELTTHKAVKLKEETDLSQLKTVHVGDFCISLRSFQGGFEYSKYEGVVSPAYQIFYATDEISNDYYRYLFKDASFIDKMNSYTMSLRDGKNIAFFDFANTFLPVPGLDEQKHIASYLDSKCSKIDAIIAKQQTVIEKLKEYKQQVITEAVLGVKNGCESKDSGFFWIRRIPFNWKCGQLKYFASIRAGITLGKKYSNNAELIEMPYLRVANVQGDYVDLEDIATLFVMPEEIEKYKLHKGELLMTEGGDRDKLGRGSVWQGEVEPCLHQNHVFAVRTDDSKLDVFYLDYVTSSDVGRVYFDYTAKKTTNLASTNSTTILEFRFPIPPLNEQRQIVDFLDRKCSAIDATISKKQALIEKLKAYKKSLIYEVVTGKKEV